MLSGIFHFRGGKASREKLIRDLASCLNERAYARLPDIVSEDIVIADVNARQFSGRDRMLSSEREYSRRIPDRKLVIETMHHYEDAVLVSGRFESRNVDVAGPAMWRVGFSGDKIARIDVTRADNQMTLPKFAAHFVAR